MNVYTRLPRVPLLGDRKRLIVERSRGKRVLHLGCVDAGLVQERFRSGELMHGRLAAVADTLWGVDIDQAGIEFLRSEGFDHLILGDICDTGTLEMLRGTPFDVLVASEVVEHLLNPGLFLTAARRLMTPGQTELMITVPNAFRVQTLLWLFRGVEYVHPDHNYWFSYVTAANLLRKTGFELTEIYVYSLQPRGILPLRKFRHIQPSNTSTPEIKLPTASGVSPSAAGRVATYIRSLPKRVLTSVLYRTTPFWGDGLILIAKVPCDG